MHAVLIDIGAIALSISRAVVATAALRTDPIVNAFKSYDSVKGLVESQQQIHESFIFFEMRAERVLLPYGSFFLWELTVKEAVSR